MGLNERKNHLLLLPLKEPFGKHYELFWLQFLGSIFQLGVVRGLGRCTAALGSNPTHKIEPSTARQSHIQKTIEYE